MPRDKRPTPPLLAVKHDFVTALDRVMQESIVLIQAIEISLRAKDMPKPIAATLAERVAAFRRTIFTEGV